MPRHPTYPCGERQGITHRSDLPVLKQSRQWSSVPTGTERHRAARCSGERNDGCASFSTKRYRHVVRVAFDGVCSRSATMPSVLLGVAGLGRGPSDQLIERLRATPSPDLEPVVTRVTDRLGFGGKRSWKSTAAARGAVALQGVALPITRMASIHAAHPSATSQRQKAWRPR